jgi:hypothetical protein
MKNVLLALFFILTFSCTSDPDPGEGEGEGEVIQGEGEGETPPVVLCDDLPNYDACGTFNRPMCGETAPTVGTACATENLACLYCSSTSRATPTQEYTCDLERWALSRNTCSQ